MSAARIALIAIATFTSCSDRHQSNSFHSLDISRTSDRSGPRISWRDGAFFTTALPAVARSADIVILALRENDAGRGFPNLRLEIRDRNDAPIRSIELLNSNQYEALAPAGVATPALLGRIAAANAQLEQIHAAHKLTAMAALELQQPNDDSDPHIAIGDGLRVDWRGDRLDVFANNGTRRVASADGRGWLAPPQPSCATCEPCKNPAYLGAIYRAASIDVVVAQIRYRGTDACWEPSDQFHVVAW